MNFEKNIYHVELVEINNHIGLEISNLILPPFVQE